LNSGSKLLLAAFERRNMNYFNTKYLINFAQQTADAISSVLDLQVTIVDSDVRRVAGTGCFSLTLDKVLSPNYIFYEVIRTGERCFIENPGKTPICRDCEERDSCREKATLLIPVKLDGQVIGAIGIAAMNDEEKRKLSAHTTEFTVFMEKMADMLAAKVRSELYITELSLYVKRFETLVNAFQDGIIFVDAEGRLIHYNRPAEIILKEDLSQYIGTDIRNIIKSGIFNRALETPINIEHQKIAVSVNGRSLSLVAEVKTILVNNNIEGFVAYLEETANSKKKLESVFMSNVRYSFDDIVGESEGIKKCIELAKKISQSNSSVLILGESGTGKELFARAIHNESKRAKCNFIAINCGAIPDTLLESELFGYEGGSFTGAKKEGNPGKFEMANGGTIFLDEIGDMPVNLQAKLLRVLQDREVVRIGDSRPIPIDVRIIAATNKDMEELIEQGLFRRDLYYRINVIPIKIPPFRERKEDLKMISEHLLKKHSALLGKMIEGIEDEAMMTLKKYDWPGNVRELENVIEYAVNMETGKELTAESLPAYLTENTDYSYKEPDTYEMSLKDSSNMSERNKIISALRLFEDNTKGKKECAKYLKISLSTLYRKLKEYNIK